MTASKYHFNTINRVFKVLKSYNRISLETFSIQILFFKNLDQLNSKSKRNLCKYRNLWGFLINFYSACFLRTKEIVWLVFLIFREWQPQIVLSFVKCEARVLYKIVYKKKKSVRKSSFLLFHTF